MGEETQSAFENRDDLYGKEIKVEAPPKPQVDIDLEHSFYQNIANQGINSSIDTSVFNDFLRAARTRDELYELIDAMGDDPIIAAFLETCAEDATEYDTNGHIMWAESSDPRIAKYVNFLLESLNVDKNAYKWIYLLTKYGELYLRLYRKSDFSSNDLFNKNNKSSKKPLKEDVKISVYSDDDPYEPYLGLETNPAIMFELTRFDKSYAYIKCKTNNLSNNVQTRDGVSPFFSYSFTDNDVEIYQPTTYVHACLEDNVPRAKEEVTIFKGEEGADSTSYTYTVRRGQSMLYPVFKIWRELSLLENVIMLNRVTRSSLIRIIGVEISDMPKEMVAPHLQGIKAMFEQKSNINVGRSFGEYNNPGPAENNIYVPTKNGVGALSTQEVGGNVDVGKLTDLDYFQDLLFGALAVPKAFFSKTDDGAGFNGGETLAQTSSRYAKKIKRLQNTLIQAITSVINIFLISRGMGSYIHKFTLKMTSPVTKEEESRRDALSTAINLSRDVMSLLTDEISDRSLRLQALKELLSTALPGTDITSLVQQAIDKERGSEGEDGPEADSEGPHDDNVRVSGDLGIDLSDDVDLDKAIGLENSSEENSEEDDSEQSLPTPEELMPGMDFTADQNS